MDYFDYEFSHYLPVSKGEFKYKGSGGSGFFNLSGAPVKVNIK